MDPGVESRIYPTQFCLHTDRSELTPRVQGLQLMVGMLRKIERAILRVPCADP